MTLGELLRQGGWAMYPLYLCSFAAAVLFVRKLLEFRALRLSDLRWTEAALTALRRGDHDGVRSLCEASPHPAARVMASMTTQLEVRPERAEAEAQRVGSLELQSAERHLSTLSFIAQVAPLLGLLGTVLGMVDLFLGLQGAGMANVDVTQLSTGIWKALLTTAAGLMVAVPAMAGHALLTSRTDRLRLQMADVAARVLNEAPALRGEGRAPLRRVDVREAAHAV